MPVQVSKKRAPTRSAEQELWLRGYDIVVGIDEVGRGAWAGPLMVGAAVLPRARRVNGVRDSKMLTEVERERLFDRVARWCDAWAVGAATREECDELGMAPAQRIAARRAIEALGVEPDAAVVDGRWNFVGTAVPHVERMVKADAFCLSVAAASILAKVTRDRYMRSEAEHYPHWSFDSNKGYPCPVHKAALQGYGPSAIHRRTWIFMDHYVPWPGLRVIRPEQPTLFPLAGPYGELDVEDVEDDVDAEWELDEAAGDEGRSTVIGDDLNGVERLLEIGHEVGGGLETD